jgi:hypothetical protein
VKCVILAFVPLGLRPESCKGFVQNPPKFDGKESLLEDFTVAGLIFTGPTVKLRAIPRRDSNRCPDRDPGER